jgi:SAM-dependent methyltransferase
MSDLCNVCGGRLNDVPAYAELPRVSSDCKPVAAGGAVASCLACGSIQKPITAAFLSDIAKIYAAYDVYYQGGGMEQIVNDALAGRPVRRSEVLASRLLRTGLLPASGRAIDLGCGNGAFLRALSARLPGWRLHGLELDRRHEAALATIPGFAGLEIGFADDIAGTYDLISMIHALEHFTEPLATLARVRAHLAPGGLVFIEIPNVAANPFDLLIADHVSHVTPWSLETMLARAGFETVMLATDWVGKEVSLLVRAADRPGHSRHARPRLDLCATHIGWLTATLARAKSSARQRPFGLFGTSIAATWMSGALGGSIDFYIDEDQSRHAHSFFGKPVLGVAAVPAGSTVFVGLAPVIAGVVAERLTARGLASVPPPPLPAD